MQHNARPTAGCVGMAVHHSRQQHALAAPHALARSCTPCSRIPVRWGRARARARAGKRRTSQTRQKQKAKRGDEAAGCNHRHTRRARGEKQRSDDIHLSRTPAGQQHAFNRSLHANTRPSSCCSGHTTHCMAAHPAAPCAAAMAPGRQECRQSGGKPLQGASMRILSNTHAHTGSHFGMHWLTGGTCQPSVPKWQVIAECCCCCCSARPSSQRPATPSFAMLHAGNSHRRPPTGFMPQHDAVTGTSCTQNALEWRRESKNSAPLTHAVFANTCPCAGAVDGYTAPVTPAATPLLADSQTRAWHACAHSTQTHAGTQAARSPFQQKRHRGRFPESRHTITTVMQPRHLAWQG